MVKITFESPSVQLSRGDITAEELINFFHVERPGINLNIKRRNNRFQNISPGENGMFKCPRDVEVAIMVVVKELKHTEEHNLGVVQNTFSLFTEKAPKMKRFSLPASSSLSPSPTRRGNAQQQAAITFREQTT